MPVTVAVRALVEFSAKRGDLDLRFTPAPSAQQGIVGHGIVASRRGPAYESEISLSGRHEDLWVRGRADGYDAQDKRLDECKTFRGDLDRMPGNHRALHWAQAKIYGWLMCQRDALQEIDLALVYFDIDSQQETVLRERFTAVVLQEFYQYCASDFGRWAQHQSIRTTALRSRLKSLAFPHERFHDGQRELAEAAYVAASRGRCVMAQAPTGIGKTIGTLFPLLKSLSEGKIDRIFYLAAKTPGRRLALDALATIEAKDVGIPLVTLELVARDKVCEHPDKVCHGDSCPLARGFYDRLPRAREAALACNVLDQATLREVARQHAVCPYYLGQEMARWSDVVVGDYSYYFDRSGLLHELTIENQWRAAVLVDEAHNLVERGRQMYSATLDLQMFKLARGLAPANLKERFVKILRSFAEILQAQSESYAVLDDIPEHLMRSLEDLIIEVGDALVAHASVMQEELQDAYFATLRFSRAAEEFGEHSLLDVTRSADGEGVLCVRNVVPGIFLRARFERAHCAILFSATLHPRKFYQDMLGLAASTTWLDVATPFDATQLEVRIANISTRYRARSASLPPIAAIIREQFERQPGNYLCFVSSFDYLDALLALFREFAPDVPVWHQQRRMQEPAKQAFLQRFAAGGQGVGFAVLGGAFAEGIDLPGDRLIGAFVATLGLPQVNRVNDQIMRRMEEIFGEGVGYDYTYRFPGLQKVVQAAGRVIRTTQDRGVLYLIDDRYAQREVQELLPSWWSLTAGRKSSLLTSSPGRRGRTEEGAR